MSERDESEDPRDPPPSESTRRKFLKGSGVVAGGLAAGGLAGATVPGVLGAAEKRPPPENPYGARPGGGISLPDYYKP